MKKIFLSSFIALFFISCSYHSSTKQGLVGVDRKQIMLVNQEKLNQDAITAYQKVIDEAKKKNILNKDIKQYNRINRITKSLIPFTVMFQKNAKDWKWEVNLIESKELNAWCMPGGKIVVYSGIINKLKLNDDELATILGHEIAHALREHSRESASYSQIINGALTISGMLFDIQKQHLNLASQAVNLAVMLPHSREAETEADLIGLELMARAGFNPNSSIVLWEKMEKLSKSGSLEFLSTHPSNKNRIKNLKKMIKKVENL